MWWYYIQVDDIEVNRENGQYLIRSWGKVHEATRP